MRDWVEREGKKMCISFFFLFFSLKRFSKRLLCFLLCHYCVSAVVLLYNCSVTCLFGRSCTFFAMFCLFFCLFYNFF